MVSISKRTILCTTTAFAIAMLTGCSSDHTASDVAAKNKTNIQRLANLYAAYQNMKSSGGPKDEADFKEYIKGYPSDKLKMMSIDANNLDELFGHFNFEFMR